MQRKMTTDVETFLEIGCMRCDLGNTPQCKVHRWHNELVRLRSIVRDCGLTEEAKWGQPCYTFNGKNVLIMAVFKEYAFISFFKGALLSDSEKLLEKPGTNSQHWRQLRFTSVEQIDALEASIKAYIFEAIEIEKAGLKVVTKKNPEPIPEELEAKFKEMPRLKEAFFDLTPGRQRGYIIHFSQPKKTETRTSRIEKMIPKILSGKGFHD